MKLKLELSDRAENELFNIYGYSIEQFGIVQAKKYLVELEVALHKLLLNPLDGTRVEKGLARRLSLPSDIVRSSLYVQHRIYFIVDEERLFVLSILHSARDTAKAFREIKRML
jgi:plasmid stabilization system protein ParE